MLESAPRHATMIYEAASLGGAGLSVSLFRALLSASCFPEEVNPFGRKILSVTDSRCR